MPWFYRNLIRPALFAQDSEAVHDRTIRWLGRAAGCGIARNSLKTLCSPASLPVDVFGLRFPNPVGLAAGMDKQAAAVPVWESLGFGFCELGGVTWEPQPGNPKPRMFRAPDQRALINRMGFNNPGAEAIAGRLAQWKKAGLWPTHPVGINLGKSKNTPLDDAARDYAASFKVLLPHADFFVVNVSSPNTPGLRKLQDRTALDEILAALQEINFVSDPPDTITEPKCRPILVKVAPDLALDALDEILELCGPRGVSGIVATNTTVERPETADAQSKRVYAESGGLSGAPLRSRSTEVVRHLFRQTRGRLPIIGVGGIFNAADAWEKIQAGASLVQIYTGLVYEGPGIVGEIVRGLDRRLRASGFEQLSDAIGAARSAAK